MHLPGDLETLPTLRKISITQFAASGKASPLLSRKRRSRSVLGRLGREKRRGEGPTDDAQVRWSRVCRVCTVCVCLYSLSRFPLFSSL